MNEISEKTLGRLLANETAVDLLLLTVFARDPKYAPVFMDGLEKAELTAIQAFGESPVALEAFSKRAAALRALAAQQ
ncbi:MAG: hypothetical protein LBI66_08495 [Burkholderiaceae bacterium]|jgi:hypothetical protein|nr:hypothetical protein [Burkholderiaceae bacterium]